MAFAGRVLFSEMSKNLNPPPGAEPEDVPVLLLHDSSVDPSLWRATLGHGWSLVRASSEADLQEHLDGSNLPSLVIVEMRSYASVGRRLLALLREREAGRQVPVMVVVPHEDEAGELMALDDGAQDVLRQPISVRATRARARRLADSKNSRFEWVSEAPSRPADLATTEQMLPMPFMVLLQAHPDGLVLTAGSGKLAGCSDEFLRMWNLSPQLMESVNHRELRDAMAEAIDPAAFDQSALKQDQVDELLAGRAGDVPTKAGRRLRLIPIDVGVPSAEILKVDCWRDVTEVYTKQDWRMDTFVDKLLDALPYQVYVKDLNSRFVKINRNLAGRLGLHDPGLAVGKTDADFHASNHAKRTREEERMMMQTGKPLVGQLHQETWADGRTTWNMSTKVPFRDATGAVKGLFGVSHDVTVEREHRQAIRDLEAFAYSVAHDLSAPVRAISGFAQILGRSDEELSPQQRSEFLQRILEAARRMDRTIEDILRLSRMTFAPLVRDSVDLSALAADVATTLKRTHDKATFRIQIADGLRADADAGLLQIALANLMSNAVKYSGQAQDPLIEVGRAQIDGRSWFFVRDNGVGFDESKMSSLFQQFHRLDYKSAFTGSGIGLSIVKRIIDRHNGDIFAKATSGVGACFYFRLSPS